MTNIKDYMLWLKQNQENNPDWKSASKFQNRNQTKINEPPPPRTNDETIIDETPKPEE